MNDAVIYSVIHAIKQSGIKQGEQLPSERELSSDIPCSRTSLRVALAIMDALKLVKVQHGKPTIANFDAKEIHERWNSYLHWYTTGEKLWL